MRDTISIPGLIWSVLWRSAIGAAIFHYGLERIHMLDRMHAYAMSLRPMDANWHTYFLLNQPDMLYEYMLPLLVWLFGGAAIVRDRDGISLMGVAIFAVAALPFAAYYGFCALTIAMVAGLVGALLASITSILGPLYLIEPLLFAGFVAAVFGSLGD